MIDLVPMELKGKNWSITRANEIMQITISVSGLEQLQNSYEDAMTQLAMDRAKQAVKALYRDKGVEVVHRQLIWD
jgi:hypothetical protein